MAHTSVFPSTVPTCSLAWTNGTKGTEKRQATQGVSTPDLLRERQLHEGGIDVIRGNVRGRFGEHALDVAVQRHTLVEVLPRATHGLPDQTDKILYGKGVVRFCGN